MILIARQTFVSITFSYDVHQAEKLYHPVETLQIGQLKHDLAHFIERMSDNLNATLRLLQRFFYIFKFRQRQQSWKRIAGENCRYHHLLSVTVRPRCGLLFGQPCVR
ncbi:MAG: hypothetical protein U5K79_01975 [Cyclobacteriaceae bacterium]|nr:hypothetical protein [Cyclobacteriaceae bacterium]